MTELQRWTSPASKGLVTSPESRKYGHAMERVGHEARLQKTEQDAVAALGMNAMDRLTDLDDLRQQYTKSNPEIGQVLAEIELSVAQHYKRGLRDFGS